MLNVLFTIRVNVLFITYSTVCVIFLFALLDLVSHIRGHCVSAQVPLTSTHLFTGITLAEYKDSDVFYGLDIRQQREVRNVLFM